MQFDDVPGSAAVGLDVTLERVHDLEPVQLATERSQREGVVGVARPSTTAGNLLGGETGHEIGPAEPEGRDDALMDPRSDAAGKVHEEHEHHVERLRLPPQVTDRTDPGVDDHAPLSRQAPGLGDGDLGEIDGHYLESLLGQPDSVAALPVPQAQRRPPRRRGGALHEEPVGLGAEQIAVDAVTVVPVTGAPAFERHGPHDRTPPASVSPTGSSPSPRTEALSGGIGPGELARRGNSYVDEPARS